jgi:hypothetical protein
VSPSFNLDMRVLLNQSLGKDGKLNREKQRAVNKIGHGRYIIRVTYLGSLSYYRQPCMN